MHRSAPPPRSRLPGLFALAVATLALFALSTARAAVVPTGFTDSTVASGLASPTAMVLTPDGRIFVAQQGGQLRVIKNGALLATPFLTVSVNSSGERGLIGVALDPAFASNGHVYVYYTTSAAPIHNRVSRFTASAGNPDVAGATETILLDLDNLSSATNHNGGALRFGVDGKLYVAVGDNATGSNAQTLANRHGKVLRVNADGSIPADNPFYATATGLNRAIWALGLRNPYTFSIQPVTGRMMINDVGQSTWEEIDDGVAGRNFGWPTAEGPTNCANAGFTCPVYSYGRSQGCAITGGDFYNPSTLAFPASYAGKYLFADYCGNWIRYIDPDAPPANDGATVFATQVSSPVDLRVGSDGSLYYLARGSGSVGRIQYTAAQPPTITLDPLPQTVPVNGTATFTCSASGSAPIAYRWQRNSVDIGGATSSTLTRTNVPLADNGALFRCAATNAFGEDFSATALLTVTTNTPPTATILTPIVDARFNAGQVITFSGSASDAQDASIPPANFTWEVDFHHDTHTHPHVAPFSGATGGSFTASNAGHPETNVWYRIRLTVRDSGGLTHTVTRDILPNTATLSFATSPAGLALTLDGQPLATPAAIGSVVGMQRAIGAAAQQTVGATTWQFVSWSDGGARNHNIATPAGGGTYTATFVAVASANVALASQGGVASASSTFSNDYAPAGANDGEVTGADWRDNGGWADATPGAFPDWLQVNFGGTSTIDRVVVYSLQDNYVSPIVPTDATTFSLYGITAFQVQTWNGSSWVTRATVTGNNLVKRTASFAPVATDRVRVLVDAAQASYSRVVEVEAWTPGAAATATALASSLNPSIVGQSVTFTATVTGTNPTGNVAFRDGANVIGGCSAVALTGAGNVRTATCATSALIQGTRSITAAYAGDAGNGGSTSAALPQIVNAAGGGTSTNVALASNGGVASASSSANGFSPSSLVNGELAGVNWSGGGGWKDGTNNAFPDTVDVVFNGSKTIDRVVVYSIQDNFGAPLPPNDVMTFGQWGVTDFQVQRWTGSAWVTVASVSGNNLVKRTVTFAAVATDRIRINIIGALGNSSRLTEVEAWTSAAGGPPPSTTTLASSLNPSIVGQSVTFTATVSGANPTGNVAFQDGATNISGCSAVALAGSGNVRNATCATAALVQGTRSISAVYAGDAGNATSTSSTLSQVVNAAGGGGPATNVARASNGGTATASSSASGHSPASLIDGETAGVNWSSGGGWKDGTNKVFPDTVDIVFNGSKTIDRVVVYSIQDNWTAPSPPTDTMTFSQFGVTDFQVQRWTGSAWVTVASVSGNSLVKRTVTFGAVATDRIRIQVNGAAGTMSRLTEIEAWTP